MTDKDFEEMRQQMNLLKEKLKHQEVVNEQLMRRAIETKLNRLSRNRRFKRFYMISSMVFIPLLLVKSLELPLWFGLATVAMIAIALIYHEVFMEHIDAGDLNSNSIHEINTKAIRLKEQGARWLRIGIPMTIVWVITFIFILQQSFDLETDGLRLIYSLAFGTIVGASIGYISYRKKQRMIDEISSDFLELE